MLQRFASRRIRLLAEVNEHAVMLAGSFRIARTFGGEAGAVFGAEPPRFFLQHRLIRLPRIRGTAGFEQHVGQHLACRSDWARRDGRLFSRVFRVGGLRRQRERFVLASGSPCRPG